MRRVCWVTHACLKYWVGCTLGCFFCALLINYHLGINAEWLSTKDNTIADEISRLWALHNYANEPNIFDVDYQLLFQSSPVTDVQQFVPNKELISCLQFFLINQICPSLEWINKLKQAGLGRLITSTG